MKIKQRPAQHRGPHAGGSTRAKLERGVLALLLLTCAGVALLWPDEPAPLEALPQVEPERIQIRIPPPAFRKLEEWREQALARETLYGVEQEFVEAELEHAGEVVPIRIRLKGGGARDHLGGPKWSFRVETRGGAAVLGMDRFSLMDPQRRGMLLEWLTRRLVREAGLIGKDYRFVELVLNGSSWGVYAMDQHYGKAMLEANERREGPIVRLDQAQLWHEGAAFALNDSQRDDYYFAADVSAIGEAKARRDPAMRKLLEQARRRYQAFRRRELPAHQVFDEQFATWLALGDVLGAWHGFGAWNLKFYYNPITTLLEPVPDDSFNEEQTVPTFQETRLTDPIIKGRFLEQVFSDLTFTEVYLRKLEAFSQPDFLDARLRALQDEVSRQLAILRRDYPDYAPQLEQLARNRENVRNVLQPYLAATSYLHRIDGETIALDVAPLKLVPLEVVALVDGAGRELAQVEGPRRLPGKPRDAPLVFTRVTFRCPGGAPPDLDPGELTLRVRVLGTTPVLDTPVQPGRRYRPEDLEGDLFLDPVDLDAFEFLSVSEPDLEIRIAPGRWTLSRPLLVPAGYTLVAGPGTELDIQAGGLVLSRSPLRFLGEEEAPVRLFSSDGAGMGLVVLEAERPSVCVYVHVEGLRAPTHGDWALTGALTFYRAPVQLQRCVVARCPAEDGLNVVRAGFELEEVQFEANASDALDVDFGVGSLRACSFRDSGNDAVDVSGSQVRLYALTVDGAGDKGISAGEASKVEVDGATIRAARVGVASKDLSTVALRNLQLSDCEVGLAAYRKKAVYGRGVISLEEPFTLDAAEPTLIEVGSLLQYTDDQRLEYGTRSNVFNQLYGAR